jgi:hypothetical protein
MKWGGGVGGLKVVVVVVGEERTEEQVDEQVDEQVEVDEVDLSERVERVEFERWTRPEFCSRVSRASILSCDSLRGWFAVWGVGLTMSRRLIG